MPLKPDAVVYVPAGHSPFVAASILVTDFTGGRLVRFEVNANGDPIAATAKDVVTCFSQVLGVARDPFSGDFLVTQFSGSSIFLLARLSGEPPSVSLTSPANNATFGSKEQIPLTATASVPSGSNASIFVEFFDGTTLVGTSQLDPFQTGIGPLALGVHRLTAVATANGLTATSSVVSITITNTPKVLPAVQLTSPSNLLTITDCSLITLTATASDSDGTVTQVSFFDNGLVLGTVSKPPYTLIVEGLPFSPNSLTMSATDDLGGSSTSNLRTVYSQLLPVNKLKAPVTLENRLQLCFRGGSGIQHVFESTKSLLPPILWQPFATNTAAVTTDGMLVLTDPTLNLRLISFIVLGKRRSRRLLLADAGVLCFALLSVLPHGQTRATR